MKTLILSAALLFATCSGFGQSADSTAGWEFSSDLNFYFIPDDFFVLPVLRADNNKLHLEARYNYEDRETFSGWVGYNFTGGKKVEYVITPMAGAVMGLTQGLSAGLELTFTGKRLELASQWEYLYDTRVREDSFIYTWSDLTYSINDWLWAGLSAQRTKLYQTDLDIQRGFLVGASFKKLEVSTYLYNLGFDDPFVLVTLTANF